VLIPRDWSEWQSRRRSPARCLRCAGPVAAVPARNDESLPHRACGGTIKTGITIGSSLERAATYLHVYDIEGALLEQGRKPTFPNGSSIPTYEPLTIIKRHSGNAGGMGFLPQAEAVDFGGDDPRCVSI